jgi:hypothetical protein
MIFNIRDADLTDSGILNELGYNIYRSHFSHMWISESEMNVFLDAEYSYPAL